MDDPPKFLLPKPDFSKKVTIGPKSTPHFLTPSGMTLLPRDKQPPPMYGPKGSTIPAKFLAQQKNEEKPQERHFCEPCEMELQSIDDFRRHRAQHERCPVDGCKYRAHPSVMDKHVTELHNSGIFEKIRKISTPEEIAAWREERRKKYPTLANTQMRQLAQEQRQKRGERLEENKARFGRHEDRKRARNIERCPEQRPSVLKGHQNRQQERINRGRDKRPPRKMVKPVDSKQSAASLKTNEQSEEIMDIISCGIRMFEGTSGLKNYKHEKAKEPQTKNVLSNLLGMYGSDEEDDDDSDAKDEENDSETSIEEKQLSDEIDKLSNSRQQTKDCNIPEHQDLVLQDLQTPSKAVKHNTPICVGINTLHDPQNEDQPDKAVKTSCTDTAISTTNLNPEDSPVILNNSKQNADAANEITTEDKCTDNSSDEAPEEAPIERTTVIPCAIENPSSSTSNLKCEASTSKRAKLEDSKKSVQHKRKYGLDYRKGRLRKQNTMLEKLLEPDIRHERNVLLQCVRFVCQNNFFGIGSENILTDNKTPP